MKRIWEKMEGTSSDTAREENDDVRKKTGSQEFSKYANAAMFVLTLLVTLGETIAYMELKFHMEMNLLCGWKSV
ncbi:hypothetical protein QLX08_004812 [Tetragonisca angustula]|uniref:Uncharacterized protein n=1 Tax=Tetragonisca angustula TaxID=166442 RepID=A0AAW1A0W8_9HYME